jgi:hypothetical protein
MPEESWQFAIGSLQSTASKIFSPKTLKIFISSAELFSNPRMSGVVVTGFGKRCLLGNLTLLKFHSVNFFIRSDFDVIHARRKLAVCN